jgi:hypothetical protein
MIELLSSNQVSGIHKYDVRAEIVKLPAPKGGACRVPSGQH